jgi:hypothetical protein
LSTTARLSLLGKHEQDLSRISSKLIPADTSGKLQ